MGAVGSLNVCVTLGMLVKLGKKASVSLPVKWGQQPVLSVIDNHCSLDSLHPGKEHDSKAGRRQISPQTTLLCPSRGERLGETSGAGAEGKK